MRIVTKAIRILGILVFVAPLAVAKTPTGVEPGSIVIVFKDGRQQSFRLADIARIDFNALNAPAEKVSPSRARFLGQWRVGNGMGGTFIITLKPEGEAHKTMGAENGMWTVVNGEVRIAWDDGWHDFIRKVDNRYEKAAYRPGSSLSGPPENVAEAVYIEAH